MPQQFYNWTASSSASRPLKILLGATVCFTLGSALIPALHLPSLFGLSRLGIDQFFYWQWISYFLIQPPVQGISFSLFIQLGFSLYLLWVFGNSLIDRLGQTRFFTLFFGSVLAGGLGAWGALEAMHSPYIFLGPTTPLYACLFAWTLLNEEARLFLFFTIPLKARTALYVLLGGTFLIDLSQAQWPSVAGLLAGIAYSYFFTLIACQIRSPFSFLHPFERIFMRYQNKAFFWKKKKTLPTAPVKFMTSDPANPF